MCGRSLYDRRTDIKAWVTIMPQCLLFTGATRELWATRLPPSYTITILKSLSLPRAPTKSRRSSTCEVLTAVLPKILQHISSSHETSGIFFSNLLKATANDEVSLENSSVTKSQKNFSFSSSASNNRSSVSGHCSPPSPRCREATEEEAERSEPLDTELH